MPYLYYGYDPYFLLLIPALLISLWAQIRVKSAYSRYAKAACPLTGAEAARRVLELNGVYGVGIQQVSGTLTDHYDPKANVIRLSDGVYSGANVAAVGVAAHEAGHAVQYAKGYTPIKIRAAILPVSQIGSQAAFPLLILGIVFSFELLINLGIVLFCAALLFQLVTLPVEFNASRRAITTIRQHHLLTGDGEVKGAARVLKAAAMTYVAAAIVSVIQLIRLIALAGRRK